MKHSRRKDLFDCSILLRKACIYLLVILYTGDVVSQNIGINQPNPIWPLDISSTQCVARLTATLSPYGSVLELKNTNAQATYLGAMMVETIRAWNEKITVLQNENSNLREEIMEMRKMVESLESNE